MAWLKWPKWLVATEQRDTDAPEACSTEVLNMMVLRTLHKTLRGYNDVNARNAKSADLDREQDEINRITDWARTLLDLRVRKEYFGWLDFFQRGLNEARKELSTEKGKTAQEKWSQKQDEFFAKVRDCETTNPIPTPPERP
jgi:hypothetical protein